MGTWFRRGDWRREPWVVCWRSSDPGPGRLWADAGRSAERLTRFGCRCRWPGGLLLVAGPTFCLRISAA